MNKLIRLCLFLVVIELIFCGWQTVTRLQRPVPVIPDIVYDDELLKSNYQALASQAETGTSVDFQLLAEGLLGGGFFAYAEQNYRAALELDPGNYEAQFGLAFCLDRTGRVEKSNKEYLATLELKPSREASLMTPAHIWYAIGKNELRDSNVLGAKDAFRQIPGFAPSEYQLAKLLLRQGDSENSLQIINRALDQIPESLKFQHLKYRALLAQKQNELAFLSANNLERSVYVVPVNFNSDFVMPFSQRHGLNRKNERIKNAIESGNMDRVATVIEEIIEELDDIQIPGYRSAYLRLAEVELQRKNPQKILECVEKLKEFGEMNSDILQLEGAAYEMLGQSEQAAAVWERAALMSPNVILHQKLADYYDSIKEAKRRDDHLGHRSLLQTKIEFWSNNLEAAEQSLQPALILIPETAQVWFYLGQIKSLTGDRKAAIEALTKCLDLDPNFGRAQVALEFVSK